MIRARGVVEGIEKNGWARVISRRTETRGGCHSQHDCRTCLSHAKTKATVLNLAGAKEGDLVSIRIDAKPLIKGAALIYLLPVAGMLLGALLGPTLGKTLSLNETASALLWGFAGLCTGFFVAGIIARKMSAGKNLTPIIDRIIIPKEVALSLKTACLNCEPNTQSVAAHLL